MPLVMQVSQLLGVSGGYPTSNSQAPTTFARITSNGLIITIKRKLVVPLEHKICLLLVHPLNCLRCLSFLVLAVDIPLQTAKPPQLLLHLGGQSPVHLKHHC